MEFLIMGAPGIKFKGNVQDEMKNKKHNLILCCFLVTILTSILEKLF